MYLVSFIESTAFEGKQYSQGDTIIVDAKQLALLEGKVRIIRNNQVRIFTK